MKYMGSKARIAKKILPLMLRKKSSSCVWVEPFVGGGNLIQMVPGSRLGFDSCSWTIEAMISIRDAIPELPKNKIQFTEDDYKKAREDLCYPHRGYIGYALSYGGKWFGGWCRDSAGKRDYVNEAYRNAATQSSMIQGVPFTCLDYRKIALPRNSVVYCDPPYEGTTKYKTPFCHETFWDWCRMVASSGHRLFISEYQAPDDFNCLWEGTVCSSLTKQTGSKLGVERLFTFGG